MKEIFCFIKTGYILQAGEETRVVPEGRKIPFPSYPLHDNFLGKSRSSSKPVSPRRLVIRSLFSRRPIAATLLTDPDWINLILRINPGRTAFQHEHTLALGQARTDVMTQFGVNSTSDCFFFHYFSALDDLIWLWDDGCVRLRCRFLLSLGKTGTCYHWERIYVAKIPKVNGKK